MITSAGDFRFWTSSQQLQSVDAGHLQVGDNHAVGALVKRLEGVAAVGGRVHRETRIRSRGRLALACAPFRCPRRSGRVARTPYAARVASAPRGLSSVGRRGRVAGQRSSPVCKPHRVSRHESLLLYMREMAPTTKADRLAATKPCITTFIRNDSAQHLLDYRQDECSGACARGIGSGNCDHDESKRGSELAACAHHLDFHRRRAWSRSPFSTGGSRFSSRWRSRRFSLSCSVRWFQRSRQRGVRRTPAVFLTVCVAALGLGMVGWVVTTQISSLLRELPKYSAEHQRQGEVAQEGRGQLEPVHQDVSWISTTS